MVGKIRIGALISGSGTNLQAIIEARDDLQRLALLDEASEILLNPKHHDDFVSHLRQINRIFKAVLPDTRADKFVKERVAINIIYRQMRVKSGLEVDYRRGTPEQEARRAALSALAQLKPTLVLEDATVPRSRLPEMVVAIQQIAQRYNLTIGTFGHAGDGNLHPTVLCDERDRDEMERAHAFYHELYDKVLAWGGTVSGEHGIGLAKKDYLERQIGAGGVNVMRRIKRSFDPHGVLNPGKIFAEEPTEETRG